MDIASAATIANAKAARRFFLQNEFIVFMGSLPSEKKP
jgi:hypothetical protein